MRLIFAPPFILHNQTHSYTVRTLSHTHTCTTIHFTLFVNTHTDKDVEEAEVSGLHSSI